MAYANSYDHTAHHVCEALGGVWQGDRGMACCPAHDDNNPSLSISHGEDGRLLWHCFAGCDQQSVYDALKAKGLVEQTGPDPDRAQRSQEDGEHAIYVRKRQALAVTRNTDRQNRHIAESYLQARGLSVRLPSNALVEPAYSDPQAGAWFPPRLVWPILQTGDSGPFSGVHITTLRPDGSGKAHGDRSRQMLGVSKGGVVPFGGVPSDVLCIAEGVETALAIFELTGEPTWAALSATNMASIHVPVSVGEVIVCADNDTAGLDAARKLAERLTKSNKDRVVRVAVPEGEGADWLDTLPFADPADVLGAPIHERKRVPGATLNDFLAEELEPRQTILDPIIGRAESAMIFAARGVGKTFFSLALGVAMATGRDFLKWQSQSAAKVLYIDGEMTAGTMQDRLRKMCDYFGVTRDSPEISNFVIVNGRQLGDDEIMPKVNTEEGHKELRGWVDYYDPDVIFLDNLSCLTIGDEKEDTTWQLVRDFILLMRRQGRTTILIHHAGKSGAERGSSKKEDLLDLSLSLERPSDYNPEQGAKFEVVFKKGRELRGDQQRDLSVEMSMDDTAMTWTWKHKESEKYQQAIDYYKEGFEKAEIARKLAVDRSTITRWMKKAQDDGLIT